MPGKQKRNGEPPLTRRQSQLAASILRTEFDPSRDTHFGPHDKPRLLAAINEAFAQHDPPLPQNYSFRKMEDWRANCVYRYNNKNRKKNKKQPASADGWVPSPQKRQRGSTPPYAAAIHSTPPKSPPADKAEFGLTTPPMEHPVPLPPVVAEDQHVLGDTTNNNEIVVIEDPPCNDLYGLGAPQSELWVAAPVAPAGSPLLLAEEGPPLDISAGW